MLTEAVRYKQSLLVSSEKANLDYTYHLDCNKEIYDSIFEAAASGTPYKVMFFTQMTNGSKSLKSLYNVSYCKCHESQDLTDLILPKFQELENTSNGEMLAIVNYYSSINNHLFKDDHVNLIPAGMGKTLGMYTNGNHFGVNTISFWLIVVKWGF